MLDFSENVAVSGQELVVFWSFFQGSGFLPVWADVENESGTVREKLLPQPITKPGFSCHGPEAFV